ncbi:unnamed protein product [Caenorhabditis angaria]|uniref:Transmembrane protein n=1 Tax=Caenorhabditis angaria TaxID=860376 RepID=A0A9P1N8S4_9PELO|nr:unnamed protein product [Caenorhabditis angaria]
MRVCQINYKNLKNKRKQLVLIQFMHSIYSNEHPPVLSVVNKKKPDLKPRIIMEADNNDQPRRLKGANLWIAAVWFFMTFKWSLLTWRFGRKYRQFCDETQPLLAPPPEYSVIV